MRVTGLVGMDGARIMGWRMYRDYDRPYKARRATTFYGNQLWSMSKLQF